MNIQSDFINMHESQNFDPFISDRLNSLDTHLSFNHHDLDSGEMWYGR